MIGQRIAGAGHARHDVAARRLSADCDRAPRARRRRRDGQRSRRRRSRHGRDASSLPWTSASSPRPIDYSLFSLMGRTVDAMMRASTRRTVAAADHTIKVDVEGFGSLDWRRSAGAHSTRIRGGGAPRSGAAAAGARSRCVSRLAGAPQRAQTAGTAGGAVSRHVGNDRRRRRICAQGAGPDTRRLARRGRRSSRTCPRWQGSIGTRASPGRWWGRPGRKGC